MRYRRSRWGFPWIPFFFIIFFTHSWTGFLIAIAVLVLLTLIMRAIFAASSGIGTFNATPMTNQQPETHEAPYQPSYQPYQQGYQYQPTPETYQEGEQKYPQPQYEQPQIQYPEEELPPMQQ